MIAKMARGHRDRPAARLARRLAQEPGPAQHPRDEPREVARHRSRGPGGARRHPDPRRERLQQRVPGRALPAQLEGRGHLRGHEPAPHADPGRLCPRLPRGPSAALRAVAGPGLGAGHAAGMIGAPPPRRAEAPPAGALRSWRRWRPSPTRCVPDGGTARAALAAAALELAVDPGQVGRLRLALRLLESRAANLLLTGRPVAFSHARARGPRALPAGLGSVAAGAAPVGLPGVLPPADVPGLRRPGRRRRAEPAPRRDGLRPRRPRPDRVPDADPPVRAAAGWRSGRRRSCSRPTWRSSARVRAPGSWPRPWPRPVGRWSCSRPGPFVDRAGDAPIGDRRIRPAVPRPRPDARPADGSISILAGSGSAAARPSTG